MTHEPNRPNRPFRALLVSSLLVLGLSGAALAQSADFISLDTDASGTLSFEEVRSLWPEVTREQFDASDTDGSGELNQTEYEGLLQLLGQGVDVEETEPGAPAPL